MTKTNLKWRLKEAPNVENLRELVKDKILSNEEAREILFTRETDESRDQDSLKAEIKFLRELVEKLSNSRSHIIDTIRIVEKPYYPQSWYRPYEVWCGSNLTNITDSGTVYLSAGATTANTTIDSTFTSIKTY